MPVTPVPPKGEQAAEHDRAITAEHDGEFPHVDHAFGHVCECHRIGGNTPRSALNQARPHDSHARYAPGGVEGRG